MLYYQRQVLGRGRGNLACVLLTLGAGTMDIFFGLIGGSRHRIILITRAMQISSDIAFAFGALTMLKIKVKYGCALSELVIRMIR